MTDEAHPARGEGPHPTESISAHDVSHDVSHGASQNDLGGAEHMAENGGNSNVNNGDHGDQDEYLPPVMPQLHPAVSLGMRRVSSCYFSTGSLAGDSGPLDQQEQHFFSAHDQLRGGCGSTASFESLIIALRNNTESSGHADNINNINNSSCGLGGGSNHHDTAQGNAQGNFFFGDEDEKDNNDDDMSTFSAVSSASAPGLWQPTDAILYHDILMTVFTYLDAPSLTSFSETARRPNFEVFYYLQLQLQRSLLVDRHHHHPQHNNNEHENNEEEDDFLATIDGTSYLSRLASVDQQAAQAVVDEFLQSNDSLQPMPLPHSLSYIRHVIKASLMGSSEPFHQHKDPSAPRVAGAVAFVVACAGAAALMSSSGSTDVMHYHHMDSFGSTEFPNMLFGVGFVGSLMSAARRINRKKEEDDTTTANDVGTSMARSVQSVPTQMATTMRHLIHFLEHEHAKHNATQTQNNNGSFSSMMHGLARVFPQHDSAHASSSNLHRRSNQGGNSHKRSKRQKQQQQQSRQKDDTVLLTPNPYDHTVDIMPSNTTGSAASTNATTKSSTSTTTTSESQAQTETQQQETASDQLNTPNEKQMMDSNMAPTTSHAAQPRKNPSGCVGAYTRAVHRATQDLSSIVRKQRASAFNSLFLEEQIRCTSALLDACTSDGNLHLVKNLTKSMDVDQLVISPTDGSQTCALHTAALHGATQILDFLCRGIHPSDRSLDGGLCSVNTTDDNGWTALHFAAGANSVECIRILVQAGAKLQVEANNGYTPLTWARRLSNDAVVQELKSWIATSEQQQKKQTRWTMMPRQPLSMLAHQLFHSMIPTAS